MNKIITISTIFLSMSFFACSNSTNADDVDENISSNSIGNLSSSEEINSSSSIDNLSSSEEINSSSSIDNLSSSEEINSSSSIDNSSSSEEINSSSSIDNSSSSEEISSSSSIDNSSSSEEISSSSSIDNSSSSEEINSSNSQSSSSEIGIPFNLTYPIVGTNITKFYDDKKEMATTPQMGDAFYGQDANYQINPPSYSDNGDGTITDNVTGLMWQQHMGGKISFAEAAPKAASLDLGGYNDWRVPTLKELYSLILMTGQNNNSDQTDSAGWTRYIDTDYFEQPFGVPDDDDRIIDAQTWANQQYVGLTMGKDTTVFGVNFIDGRIKGYPKYNPATKDANTMYFRMVRGNASYGINDFKDNYNGTISDLATGLTWQQADDGVARDWQEALAYCEDLSLADNSSWRLPSSKELQSIVDYTRSPQTTQSAAIDPLFSTTEIIDPGGNAGQYPYFWTRTSHDEINKVGGVYIAFGEAQGEMNGVLVDVHGAGAQRSDPKSGDINNYPQFLGPQGDVLYVYNYVRCVRN